MCHVCLDSEQSLSTVSQSTSPLDVPLTDWTVEDVCYRVKAIKGIIFFGLINYRYSYCVLGRKRAENSTLYICGLTPLERSLSL